MLKKNYLKLTILFFFIIFSTGCTATYNVEIYKEKVKINGQILETDRSKWDDVVISETVSTLPSEVYDKEDQTTVKEYTYSELIDLRMKNNDPLFPKLEGLSKIKSFRKLGLKFKKNYTLLGTDIDSFTKAAGTTYCYKNFNVVTNEEDNTIIISTSLDNTCFDLYENLESIQVNLKTNHKVVSSTADKVKKHTYTWNVTKENAKNRSLQIVLEKDNYVFNYDNQLLKIGLVICIIGILGFASYRLIKRNED